MPSPGRAGLLLVVLAGCGRVDGSPSALSVARDSAGIAIVENVQPDAAVVPVWTYEQVLDLGDAGGDGPEAFYRVAGAVRLGDGRIAIADAGSAEIRFFDRTGRFLHASGRRGGGPGEFLDMAGLQRGPADTLWVFDGAAQRVTVLTADGAFVRELALFTGAGPGELAGRLADGSWIARTSDLPPKTDVRPGSSRWPVRVIRVPAEGGTADTIGAFPGREMFYRAAVKGVVATSPPFGRELRIALTGDRLWVSTGDAPEIRQYDSRGRLLRVIRTGHERVPVTPALVDSFIAERAARLPAMKTPPGATPGQVIRESIEGVPLPETLPAHGAVVAGVDGQVWVSDYPDPVAPSGGWAVYAPDGALQARVRLPAGFRLLDVGPDALVGVVYDDLDVEHVRLYRRR